MAVPHVQVREVGFSIFQIARGWGRPGLPAEKHQTLIFTKDTIDIVISWCYPEIPQHVLVVLIFGCVRLEATSRPAVAADQVRREPASNVSVDVVHRIVIGIHLNPALLFEHAAIVLCPIESHSCEVALHRYLLSQLIKMMAASMPAGVYSSSRARRFACRCG